MLQALPKPDTATPAAPLPRTTFSSPNLDWLILIAVKNWRRILQVTLVLLLGTFAALPFIPQQYQISASLLVKLGREQQPEAVSGTGPGVLPVKRSEDVTSEIEIIRSQALIEELVRSFGVEYFLARPAPVTFWQHVRAGARVVADAVKSAGSWLLVTFGLEKRMTPFEKVVAKIGGAIQAEAVKRTDVVEVKLLAANSVSGMQIMERLIELYLAEHIRAHQTRGAKEFLVERVRALQVDLARIEEDKREFGRRNGIWDLDEQRKAMLQQQRAVRVALAATAEEIGRAESEVRHAEGVLRGAVKEKRTTRVQQANPAATAMQMRLNERRANLERLKVTYGTASYQVREEELEIRKLESMLQGSSSSITATETYQISEGYLETEKTMMERKRRLAGLAAQETKQRDELRVADEELVRLDGLSEHWRKLVREFQLAEQGYSLYARRLEESRISEALDSAKISNVSVIARPSASIQPAKPQPKLLLGGALGAGLLGTFGFFLLRDAVRPAIHRRERVVEILGAPVLMRIPEVRR